MTNQQPDTRFNIYRIFCKETKQYLPDQHSSTLAGIGVAADYLGLEPWDYEVHGYEVNLGGFNVVAVET